MNLWEKKLYFVFDELMGKIYIGKKIIVWNTSEKKRLKYPNQTDEFGSDSFLKNTKNQTNRRFISSDIEFTQNRFKPVQLHPYFHFPS
jgi:hypothetical protein